LLFGIYIRMEIFEDLFKICECKRDVNLKTLCTIGIGGVGDLACFPKSVKELKNILKFLNKKKVGYFVVGNGSNIIFDDKGFRGVVIVLKKMCGVKVKDRYVLADAGLGLFALNYICKTEGLGGMEWSYGIPASVGGAVFMNAGAYGGEIKDHLKCVWTIKDGKIKKYEAEELEFGYRKSPFQNTGEIIIRVLFAFEKKEPKEIEKRQNEIFAYRKCCQPYEFRSAGSIFKRANGESAGKTIDKLGLKNVKIGQIQISEKHANFFVNLGGGTSEDLKALIKQTKQVVKEKVGIELEEEVIFVE